MSWAIKHSQNFDHNPWAYLRISLEGRCEIFTAQSKGDAEMVASIISRTQAIDLKVVPYEGGKNGTDPST